MSSQSVTYTSFQRPATISQGTYSTTFTYNPNFDRVKMIVKNGNATTLIRHYLGGRFEEDVVNDVKNKAPALQQGRSFVSYSA